MKENSIGIATLFHGLIDAHPVAAGAGDMDSDSFNLLIWQSADDFERLVWPGTNIQAGWILIDHIRADVASNTFRGSGSPLAMDRANPDGSQDQTHAKNK